MKKVSISLEQGRKHKKVGLAVYDYQGDEELVKLIKLIKMVEESLRKQFPNVEIKRQKAVRNLFGE